MRTLILISSKYGATEKCGQLIKKDLDGYTDLVNLKQGKPANMGSYDTIIIGSGIYAGNIQGDLKQLIKENEEALKGKNIGLFLCCMEKENAVKDYITNNFPKAIVDNAYIKEHAGYEVRLEKMNFVIRTMMKKIFKVKKNESAIDKEALERLIKQTNMLEGING